MKKTVLLAAIVVAFSGLSSPALATDVGLELLLLVDVSGSVDNTEYALQKTGYINAFNDATIQSNIATITGGVAVAYAEWSGSGEQTLQVGWTLLTDATSSAAFATAIGATTRAFGNLTAPGSAINFGAAQIAGNTYNGARKVIDVSGDGSQNDGANTFTAATNAYLAGSKVNGLAIQTDEPNLGVWYQANIVTPGHGFLVIASNFSDFENAVKTKIDREIVGIPEPGTCALLALGLCGLGLIRRKRKA